MNQKSVFIAGLIGLVFGVLFSGTLGLSFFGSDSVNDDNNLSEVVPMNNESNEVDPNIEQFRIDYGLSESIYIPINGEDVFDMVNSEEDFIVFAGRKTCPYCQQFVPVLQEAAKSFGVDTIYYIDITDSVNDDYLDEAGFAYPNSTFIYIDGVILDNVVGYVPLEDIEGVLSNYFSN